MPSGGAQAAAGAAFVAADLGHRRKNRFGKATSCCLARDNSSRHGLRPRRVYRNARGAALRISVAGHCHWPLGPIAPSENHWKGRSHPTLLCAPKVLGYFIARLHGGYSGHHDRHIAFRLAPDPGRDPASHAPAYPARTDHRRACGSRGASDSFECAEQASAERRPLNKVIDETGSRMRVAPIG